MRILTLICLLLPVGLAWSQAKPGLPTASPPEASTHVDEDEKQTMPESGSTVAPDAAVLTIKGLCAGNPTTSATGSPDATCETVITRAQFERLSAALQPNMPAITKRQLATSYPRLLAMAREAERRGLDKQTHFEEMIRFARLQILSQDLIRNIQDEAAQVPAKDVEDYYRRNAATFERANLERIIVPNIRHAELKDKEGLPSKAGSEDKDKEAMRQEAEKLRAQAAAGGDFAKLQQEAYDSAGLNTPPPSTSLVKTRRASLQPAHQVVFDLKPGEISSVISDADGDYVIYKLVTEETEPLSEAEGEIRKTLQKQYMHAMMQKVEESVTTDVNQAYFGPASGQHRPPQANANQNGAAGTAVSTPNPK